MLLFCCGWQCFVDNNHSGFGAKPSTQAELRDTVMALRLRETSLVSDINALKCRLIELETQVCKSPCAVFSRSGSSMGVPQYVPVPVQGYQSKYFIYIVFFYFVKVRVNQMKMIIEWKYC